YRVRSYWYVVQNIDFSPYNLSAARKNQRNLETILLRDSGIGGDLSRTVSQEERNKLIEKIADALEKTQRDMEKRFAGWTSLQDVIAHDHTAVEFRRAGAIRYDLFNMALGSEKAVDVKLATDLIKLKDIYDIAVIVSGDQDYVPAVDAIKDFGKHTVNVSFQTENGRLLPGGARRLNQSTDRILKVKHSVLQTYLNLKEVISETREEA
ncbi:MAG: NYN domain-containing protein, partial [Candidatus Sungbacteria bacterium]|nr:NYN domain-containing protein [Candidatus Sungbacteria bacterium]